MRYDVYVSIGLSERDGPSRVSFNYNRQVEAERMSHLTELLARLEYIADEFVGELDNVDSVATNQQDVVD